jgi:hypothetical protein
VKTSRFLRKLNRVAVVYQDFGLAAVASRVRRHLEIMVGREGPAHAEWIRCKASADAAFDAAYGTQTGGIQEISDFKIVGKNARYGLSHIASDPSHFTEMMADLHLDLNNWA